MSMTARDYLWQARNMQTRLDALNERRQRYEDIATSATAHYRSGPGGTRRVSSVEEYAVKLADLSAEMKIRADIYAEVLKEIEAAIDAVPDQNYRDLLRYRYMNGWSWHKIGKKLHFAESWLYQMHTRALQAVTVPADAVPVEDIVREKLKDRRQT